MIQKYPGKEGYLRGPYNDDLVQVLYFEYKTYKK